MQAHTDGRFDRLERQVDALNGVIGCNRKAIERLDASLEVLHAKVREVDQKPQGIDQPVERVEEQVTELRSEVSEVLAWVRTQRDSE